MQSMQQLFHFNFSWLLVSGCWCAILMRSICTLKWLFVWFGIVYVACIVGSHLELGASSHPSRVCTRRPNVERATRCVRGMHGTFGLPIATRFMGLSNRLDSFAVCPGQRTHTRRGQAKAERLQIFTSAAVAYEQDLLPIAMFVGWSALLGLRMLSRGRLSGSETMRKTKKCLNVISLLLLILLSICRCTRDRRCLVTFIALK